MGANLVVIHLPLALSLLKTAKSWIPPILSELVTFFIPSYFSAKVHRGSNYRRTQRTLTSCRRPKPPGHLPTAWDSSFVCLRSICLLFLNDSYCSALKLLRNTWPPSFRWLSVRFSLRLYVPLYFVSARLPITDDYVTRTCRLQVVWSNS